MGSANHPLKNIGIYHNLPTFDSSITNLTAIITGANGISGFSTLRALLDSPQRWSTIYALSRKPPPEAMMSVLTAEQRSKVKHVATDFLASPDEIASAMQSSGIVKADYIFFYSYAQPKAPEGGALWSNADELVKVNTSLLTNFLGALPKANITPRRFMLQTGAKNYGAHLGLTRQPAEEADPQPTHLDPNFYYSQEAALFEYCKAHSVSWNVVMPGWIIGATTNAAMNAFHGYGVYAAVQAKKGEPLSIPYDFSNWQGIIYHSCARLTGYLTEWVVLEDKCRDQRFNSVDSSPFVFDRFYHELQKWYGVSAGIVRPPDDPTQYMEIPGRPSKDTPIGYGPQHVHKARFSFVTWATDPKNVEVWKRLMEESGGSLTHNPFEDPESYFTTADMAAIPIVLSWNKARKLGWTGYVDTIEAIKEMYTEMVPMGMLPAMKG